MDNSEGKVGDVRFDQLPCGQHWAVLTHRYSPAYFSRNKLKGQSVSIQRKYTYLYTYLHLDHSIRDTKHVLDRSHLRVGNLELYCSRLRLLLNVPF